MIAHGLFAKVAATVVTGAVGAAAYDALRRVAANAPVHEAAVTDGGRRHAGQQRRGVVVDIELAEVAQDRHQLGQHRRQPLTGGHTQHRPAPPSRRSAPQQLSGRTWVGAKPWT